MATTLLQNLITHPFWKNPVVVRDMRVRLRGSRAFWNQAFYLGLLCIIALLGYGFSVRFGTDQTIDPVQVQSALQGFYYTVFVTVAILISLIAPGLTAVSIIFERQRLTLDLLVTTPMSSMQMLVGKLVSSIAFIILLLVLSIPISALCVILGGATIGDVLQTYALLAIDGVVLAAIGLAFSCSSKQNVQAIVGTYSAIIIYLFVTFSAGASSLGGLFGGGRGGALGASAPMPAVAAVLYLNPIVTISAPGHGVDILGLVVPAWLATGVMAFLIVRLILTGAALRLGLYGGGLVASLRRQVLFCTAIALFLTAQSVMSLSAGLSTPEAAQIIIVVICCWAYGLASFFLPPLFVPVTDEDAPQGTEVRGSYDIGSAFTAKHSGALPFFHLWLLTAAVFAVLGGWAGAGAPSIPFFARHAAVAGATNLPALVSGMLGGAAAAFFYCSGLGFLLWSLARRAATLANSYTAARPLSFLLYVFVLGVPVAIMAVLAQASSSSDVFTNSPIRFIWLGNAFASFGSSGSKLSGFWEMGALAYVYGVIAYPFWQSVTPGSGALFGKSPALSPAAAARIAGGGS